MPVSSPAPDTTHRPEPAFQGEAFAYVSAWMAASGRFMAKRTEKWALLGDLYHNRRDLRSWSVTGDGAIRKRPTDTDGDRWQADVSLSPSYLVDSWTDRAYQSIFSGPEWLTVLPERMERQAGAQAAGAFKLQELLLDKLGQGNIHARLYEILQSLVLYGSVYAKLVWNSKRRSVRSFDYESMDVLETTGRIYDCPILELIPLPKLLSDWNATHGDVQRHSGVGHRVEKSRRSIVDQFDCGVYNLPKEAFIKRWPTDTDTGAVLNDPDDLATGRGAFTVWEWHGEIPTTGGAQEWLCSIVTDAQAQSPEEGVMVRLQPGPVLWSGLRPFVAAHYVPVSGPLGIGAVESNLDLIHSISQFLSQSQDNARLTANAQLMVRRSSSAARQIGESDQAIFPGKVWLVDDPDDVRPFPPLSFPQGDVNYLINYLNQLLEKRTGVNDISLGMSVGGRTATEAHILQESAVTPFSVRTDLFARSFLEPMGRIALCMLRQFLLEDRGIATHAAGDRDGNGRLTTGRLQQGAFRVAATLTRQDSTRIAKAQSIERALPTLAQFQETLAAEGMSVSFSELIKRYLDLIGVDAADRVLRRGPAPIVTGDAPEQSPTEETNGPKPLNQTTNPTGHTPTDSRLMARILSAQATE